MSKLIPLEFKNQRIMTTKALAEEFGTEENNIKNNFNNNKSRFIENKHYFLIKGEELKEFKRLVNEIDEAIKFAPALYLWTDRGAARHAKILDTDEAWEVYEALEENYFKPKVQIPKLSKELQAIFMLDEKTLELDSRVSKIENNTTIDYSQQQELNELANKKVVAVLGGKDTPAYRELAKKAFRSFWHDYKNKLNVNSYRNTLIKDFGLAKKTIIDWNPNRELELMIKGCNSAR
ncbi:ORF6C domain-containing protein [Clostridium sp.]|uniref:ORF6C domain-containing protein n=1 Tax=Clostridium sp. TaxID=1506 RepID=UPI002604E86B|nr:ORF6C domain-containing protein [Clostridium sp.]